MFLFTLEHRTDNWTRLLECRRRCAWGRRECEHTRVFGNVESGQMWCLLLSSQTPGIFSVVFSYRTAKFANKNTKHAGHKNYMTENLFEQCISCFLKLFISVWISRIPPPNYRDTRRETGSKNRRDPGKRDTGRDPVLTLMFTLTCITHYGPSASDSQLRVVAVQWFRARPN